MAADDRFRALLELALPRFPKSLTQTYQNSDAVRPRMFFGRTDELAKLDAENGSAVVFSGRKMGKSSLLSRLQAQCSAETDRRAILVGCSGVASGRSWIVLWEIERELERLLAREAHRETPQASPPQPGLGDDPGKAMQVMKDRFRQFLDDALRQLEKANVRLLYVLLDEADNFVRAELEETSGEKDRRGEVSWFLKDLQTVTYRGRLRFIFAGYDQIGRIFRDPGLGHSAFGNWGGPMLKLGPLDQTAARGLVASPLTSLGMIAGKDVVDRILDYTSCHASLIQAFCRKLAERVQEKQADWPLNDVAIEFEDVQAVADDQRGAGDQNYRQLLEQTLGLNLDIARAYPLKLVFLALVSPNGLGHGQILGWDSFTVEDALEQVHHDDGESATGLTQTLVLDSLDLLVQLGLLDDVSDNAGRSFVFIARHFVNVLRTKNGFRAQLQQALDEWRQSGRRVNQIEPRYVWTLSDSDLRTLRQCSARPAVVLGLPRSGRGYLAEMLTSPSKVGAAPQRLEPDAPDFAVRFNNLLAAPPLQPVVVADPSDRVPWATLADWLRQAADAGMPLRWIGGPRLAWDLAGDLEIAMLIDGPFGLGPLTPAELEPWTARQRGSDLRPSAAFIADADCGPLLKLTGGLLPVLELFREWLRNSPGGFPDPLRQHHAEAFVTELTQSTTKTGRAAERFAKDLPLGLRVGLHHLFLGAREYDIDTCPRKDLAEISEHYRQLTPEAAASLLDAASWLGLLPANGTTGQVQIPYGSVLGLLIRHPRFAAP